jgi:hypothetical protein
MSEVEKFGASTSALGDLKRETGPAPKKVKLT